MQQVESLGELGFVERRDTVIFPGAGRGQDVSGDQFSLRGDGKARRVNYGTLMRSRVLPQP